MNLIDLFDTISPIGGSSGEKKFNAITIPEYPNFRIAVDNESNPVLLIVNGTSRNSFGLKNFKLKYLQLEHDIVCKILEDDKDVLQTFTVITFTCSDRNLQEYFLRIAETLIKALGAKPTPQQFIDSINGLVKIFQTLSETPSKTIHGLWTELFLIDNCGHPATLLNYWHAASEEKFDFNSGIEKIEVKSNSQFERKHIFSSEQLNPPLDTKVLIASIFIRQNSTGLNIQDLAVSITAKIEDDILIDKLNGIIFKTLGNSLEQSIKIRYDYNIAVESLRFYDCQEVRKIKEPCIPKEVTEVKYKTDMSQITSIDVNSLVNKGILFASL